jgi:hypothetical protein
MGEFFKGCRRKTGVLTLVMAAVLLGGWIQSFLVVDELAFWIAGRLHDVIAVNGTIYWCGRDQSQLKGFNYQLFPRAPLIDINGDDFGARRVKAITAVSQYKGQNGILWIFSYWFAITPLTLISLWLLLSKPRKPNQKNLNQPIPDKSV